MKKTLLTLLGIYIALVISSFVYRYFVIENIQSEYIYRAEIRKEELLKTAFTRDKSEIDSFITIEMLDLSKYILNVKDISVGEGAMAEKRNMVTIDYVAMFEDGTVFDSSKKPGRSPFQFQLGVGQVIKGWDEGIPGMAVGGTRILSVPPTMGYGMKDYGSIPGGSTLLYKIELLSVFARK